MLKLWFQSKPPYTLCFIKGTLKIEIPYTRLELLNFDDPTSRSHRERTIAKLKKHLHPDQLEELWLIFLKEGYYERA